MDKKFLIIGGTSEIGAALIKYFENKSIGYVATTRQFNSLNKNFIYMDLCDLNLSNINLDEISSVCILSAVARIKACEENFKESYNVNVIGAISLINYFAKRDIHCLFVSTNQVFDGRSAYVSAGAKQSPISVYGKQKTETEKYLLGLMDAGKNIAILRLSKVFSSKTPLLQLWKNNILEGRSIEAFTDMNLAPVSISRVVQIIYALMDNRYSGIMQFSGAKDLSYFEFAERLCNLLNVRRPLIKRSSIRDHDLGIGAAPHNTTLNCDLLESLLKIKTPNINEVIKENLVD